MDLENVVMRLAEEVEHRYYGKYRGFVVDTADPLHLGRIKVRAPSVLGEDVVSGWAMPCTPYGGAPNQGLFTVPPVDAGVWVEFEAGDPEFPIWVGTFWSAPDGASEVPVPLDARGAETELADTPTAKLFKSPKGHTLQFEDADDGELVTLVDGVNGHVIMLNTDGVRVSDGLSSHEMTLNADGVQVIDGVNRNEVTLNADGVTVSSDGDVTITGANVTITGTNVKIGADATLALSGRPVHLNP